jgi:hypothetical protein
MSLYLNNGVKQFRRIITSAKYGIMQAISSYKAENFVPEIEYEWETQPARMARYYHNRNYVYNTVYNDVTRYANTFKFQEKLYKHIRGLYNPAYRLVNIETPKVISALKVVDDTEKGKVRIEVLDPRKVTDIAFDSIGNVKYIDIRYEKQDPVSGEWYEYRECIDSESFQTFRNGSPFDYLDMSYAGTTQWDNPYGFVPVRWVQHQNVGLNFGVTSYHASRHKIDMVNDALSLLLNNVRMQVDTKFAVSKVNVPRVGGVPTTMSITSDRQDQAPFIEVGDGEIKPIVFPVNVEGALALAGVQMKEIESDLPQLALQQMRNSTGDSSGIAIENLYSDATDIIGEEQGNYLFGLQRALQMAISMASYRGYEGFAGYNLDSYENGSLDFDFRPKALFQDKLSLKERVELALQAVKSEGAAMVLPLLDFDKQQIAELELKKDERARKDVKAAFSDLMGLDEREAEAEQRLSDEKPAREYENS